MLTKFIEPWFNLPAYFRPVFVSTHFCSGPSRFSRFDWIITKCANETNDCDGNGKVFLELLFLCLEELLGEHASLLVFIQLGVRKNVNLALIILRVYLVSKVAIA